MRLEMQETAGPANGNKRAVYQQCSLRLQRLERSRKHPLISARRQQANHNPVHLLPDADAISREISLPSK